MKKKTKTLEGNDRLLLIVFLGLTVFLAATTREFLTFGNLMRILQQMSELGIVSLGIMLVILTGGFDMSSSAMIGMTSVTVGVLFKSGMNIWAAVLLGLAAALAAGLFNGWLVGELNIAPMLATLGTMTLYQGIGLALVGAVKGYRTVIIMPDSVSEERRKLVKHYGAEVVLIHDDGNIGDCIDECLATALRMAEEDKNVFVPQQFSNPANPIVHKHHTALEILEQVAGPIHGFCSGVGTGGTISGIGEVLKAQNPDILIWAVEPENAAILSGGSIGTHLQMGIGDGLIPDNLNTEIYDDVCVITDGEAIQTARDLARREGLMCGISSGTNVAAALKLAKKLGSGKTVVTVLPDTAERYFSTPLFDE